MVRRLVLTAAAALVSTAALSETVVDAAGKFDELCLSTTNDMALAHTLAAEDPAQASVESDGFTRYSTNFAEGSVVLLGRVEQPGVKMDMCVFQPFFEDDLSVEAMAALSSMIGRSMKEHFGEEINTRDASAELPGEGGVLSIWQTWQGETCVVASITWRTDNLPESVTFSLSSASQVPPEMTVCERK